VTPAEISSHEQCVVDMLKGHAGCAADQDGVTLDTGFRTFATTRIPMGLWQEKPACDWAQEPLKSVGHTIAEVNAAAGPHPHWLDAPGTDGSRHVYNQTPGEAVFGMICINCHGAQADSKGRLADNLATMTGGNALVADLRDGFFGPLSSPGTNRAQEFMPLSDAGETADDTAARYMVWMALGGTKVTIPPAFLTIIGQTPVFGTSREGGLAPPTSANMLSFARNMCMIALSTPPFKLGKPLQNGQPPYSALYYSRPARATNDAPNPLIFENGDAELWLRLCSWNNPPPVIPYTYTAKESPSIDKSGWKPQNWTTITTTPPKDLVTGLSPPPVLLRCAFEGGCPSDGGRAKQLAYTGVGDETGNILPTLSADNLHPWCLVGGDRPADLPQCDASPGDSNYDDGTVAELWAQRGAINAGLAVFLYLDSITKEDPITGKHPYAIQQAYNQCDQVKAAK
jgi:hypothetical protein